MGERREQDKQEDLAEQLILHWGEMGSRWGINRALAQIHALLFIEDRPLHAQEISERLSLARSNVSTGIRELQSWGVVSVVHLKGDRRDYFTCSKDPWEMFEVISERRMKTELEPTVHFLNELRRKHGSDVPPQVNTLAEFLEGGLNFYRKTRKLPRALIKRLLKLDVRITRLLGGGKETV
jgi:DNA-binding transcriptional regulator GbsR (MarR family)